MINFGNNLEEFINDFKERVITNAECYYPKDYRKSAAYLDKDIDAKFDIAMNSDWCRKAILETIKSYYNAIHEYEEILGY